MTILEKLALVKAGYKKADIEALEAEESQKSSNDSAEDNLTDEGLTDTDVDRADIKAESEKKEEHSEVKNEPDYKSMYEKVCADLKLAQEANLRKNIAPESKDSTVDDILNSFIY